MVVFFQNPEILGLNFIYCRTSYNQNWYYYVLFITKLYITASQQPNGKFSQMEKNRVKEDCVIPVVHLQKSCQKKMILSFDWALDALW